MQRSRLLSILQVALVSALLGGLIGALTAGLFHIIEWGQVLVWEMLTPELPLQALVVCAAGGLLVGLCQRYLGDHPKGLNEAIAAIRKTGRLEYNHLHKGLITASLSLIFGASLGPEAAIIDMVGGLSTWYGDVLQRLRGRLGLPGPTQMETPRAKWLQRWPNLIALLTGMLVFLRLLNGMYSGGFLNPGEPFRWIDLLWSIPLGLLGMAAGWLYLELQTPIRRLAAPLQRKPVWRSLVGGASLGMVALFLPMVLFSGQRFMQSTYEQAAQIGFWTLLLTAIARLFLTNLMLATGWKGGQFFPLLFSSTALGLAVCILFPAVPAPAATLAGMAGMLAIVLPQPLIALALMAVAFPLQYVGISVVAVGMVMLGKRLRPKPGGAAPLPAPMTGEAD